MPLFQEAEGILGFNGSEIGIPKPFLGLSSVLLICDMTLPQSVHWQNKEYPSYQELQL